MNLADVTSFSFIFLLYKTNSFPRFYSSAVKQVLQNQSFSEKVSTYSKVMNDQVGFLLIKLVQKKTSCAIIFLYIKQLTTPLERAAYSVEYVMRHSGAKFLRF